MLAQPLHKHATLALTNGQLNGAGDEQVGDYLLVDLF